MNHLKDFKSKIEDKDFVKAIFSGSNKKHLKKLIIRPVIIKGKKQFQFSYFDNKKDITKNYFGSEFKKQLDRVIELNFSNILITFKNKEMHIVNKEGRFKIKERSLGKNIEADFSHDRKKEFMLSLEHDLLFLQTLNLASKEGKILTDRQSKFKQINEFLTLMAQFVEIKSLPKKLKIVDFGCGIGYLTFAIYYYFTSLGFDTQIVGVDKDRGLIQNNTNKAEELKFSGMSFIDSQIKDYQLGEVDIVVALHACDTATDEALAKAVKAGAKYIFSSPCCHHNLQQQLKINSNLREFKTLFQNGILKQRMGDIITDTFRILILKTQEYRTEIVQFISSEHTDKNLLIRAAKEAKSPSKEVKKELVELKKHWQVQPFLEKLL